MSVRVTSNEPTTWRAPWDERGKLQARERLAESLWPGNHARANRGDRWENAGYEPARGGTKITARWVPATPDGCSQLCPWWYSGRAAQAPREYQHARPPMTRRPPFRIAAAQSQSVAHDIAANVAIHRSFVHAAGGVDLLVFPELSLVGYELDGASRAAIAPSDPRLEPLQRARVQPARRSSRGRCLPVVARFQRSGQSSSSPPETARPTRSSTCTPVRSAS